MMKARQRPLLLYIAWLDKPLPEEDMKTERMTRDKAKKLLAPKPRKKSVSQRIQERKKPRQKYQAAK